MCKCMVRETLRKLSKGLPVKKQFVYDNDGKDGDILADRGTHISRD